MPGASLTSRCATPPARSARCCITGAARRSRLPPRKTPWTCKTPRPCRRRISGGSRSSSRCRASSQCCAGPPTSSNTSTTPTWRSPASATSSATPCTRPSP
ncbi:hypothetical protein CS379_20925, partial [Methylobacterium frigidaeris]